MGLQAEIDANVDLAGTPNITVNSTAGLLMTGQISGTAGIIVNGTGKLTLTDPTGANTFTPAHAPVAQRPTLRRWGSMPTGSLARAVRGTTGSCSTLAPATA